MPDAARRRSRRSGREPAMASDRAPLAVSPSEPYRQRAARGAVGGDPGAVRALRFDVADAARAARGTRR